MRVSRDDEGRVEGAKEQGWQAMKRDVEWVTTQRKGEKTARRDS
jgi:hypothetical protein